MADTPAGRDWGTARALSPAASGPPTPGPKSAEMMPAVAAPAAGGLPGRHSPSAAARPVGGAPFDPLPDRSGTPETREEWPPADDPGTVAPTWAPEIGPREEEPALTPTCAEGAEELGGVAEA